MVITNNAGPVRQHRHDRVVLDVNAVPAGKGYGGVARIAIDMIDRVVDHHGVCCDGACYDGTRKPTALARNAIAA
ncbi:hypothetical protein [Mycobacterium sp.]|uniref:hypothetical protein n=1 Tax=Mycobacterium sp. TaxID=1785 RepID=UPI0031D0B089